MNSYEKGTDFEERVGRLLRRLLRDYEPDVRVNQFARGLTSFRPYQIDVAVRAKGGGIFGFLKDTHDIWVECKWKSRSSVKRDEVAQLVYRAQDVYKYCRENGGLYYDGLMLVANQRFDEDAVNVAQAEDVAWIVFDGSRQLGNSLPETWLREPAWLKRA